MGHSSKVERLFCTQDVMGQVPLAPEKSRGSLKGRAVVFDTKDVGSIPTPCKNLIIILLNYILHLLFIDF